MMDWLMLVVCGLSIGCSLWLREYAVLVWQVIALLWVLIAMGRR